MINENGIGAGVGVGASAGQAQVDCRERKSVGIENSLNSLEQAVDRLETFVLEVSGQSEPDCKTNPCCNGRSLVDVLDNTPGEIGQNTQRINAAIEKLTDLLI